MGKQAASSPPVKGASVTFLAGTRSSGVQDPFLDMAAKWVAAMQANVGAGAFAGTLGTASAAASAINNFSSQAAGGTLDIPTLDAKLGGLRSHTLVFVTHGLDVDKTLPAKDQLDTQGLLFHNDSTGKRTDTDIVLQKVHLDNMKVDKDHVVENLPGGLDLKDPGTRDFVNKVTDFVPVMDAVRQSIYQHVYLAACGTKGRLTEFAKVFESLANVTVFFNTEAIFLSDKDPTFAEVGLKGPPFKLSKGLPFFAAPTATKVDLRSGTDTFLPGSMERAP
ncbi:MAG TPA: hypothetical protein VG389_19725 [Myxococcota bacterium]|jgi:hypothetical protein|nr:hypothetical protein [Myxococcota bacterium]